MGGLASSGLRRNSQKKSVDITKPEEEHSPVAFFSWRNSTPSSSSPDHVSTQLFSPFRAGDVQPWKEGRFKHVRKLRDAPSNQGVVQLMHDQSNNDFVAVKQIPNTWVRACHKDFVKSYPKEVEFPWVDIGCTQFLNWLNFKYACKLQGVFCNYRYTFVALEFGTEGDLHDVTCDDIAPGLEREAKYSQVAFQLISAVKHLHYLEISHGDLSLENILLTKTSGNDLEVRIIDYSMASTERILQTCLRGKPSYQAPEMHTQKSYDTFLAESFSVGVILYALFMKELPWLSTKAGCCRMFEVNRAKGFRAASKKRKLEGTDDSVSSVLSEPLTELLEGVLALDPMARLTLGEHEFLSRRSVWEESWMQQHGLQQDQDS